MSLNRMVRALLERLASRIKGARYEISEKIRIRDLVEIAIHRGLMLIRGFFRGMRLQVGFPFFMEKSIVLRGRSHIKLGKGVTIYRGAELH